MASPTQWTWVCVNSRSWWWTGRPGVPWSMGSQRAGHDWATDLNWTGREKWLSFRRKDFSEPLLKHFGKSLFSRMDAKMTGGSLLENKIHTEEQEWGGKRCGFAGSLIKNLYLASHESPGLFCYKSQGIPFLPMQVSIISCHLKLKKVWLITELKEEVTSTYHMSYFSFKHQVPSMWSLYCSVVAVFPQPLTHVLSITAQTSRILFMEQQSILSESELLWKPGTVGENTFPDSNNHVVSFPGWTLEACISNSHSII